MAHMASRDYTITANNQTTRLSGGGEEGQRPSMVTDDAMDASVASSHLRPPSSRHVPRPLSFFWYRLSGTGNPTARQTSRPAPGAGGHQTRASRCRVGFLLDETKHHVVYRGVQGQEGAAISWATDYSFFSSPPFCSDALSLELEPDRSLLT